MKNNYLFFLLILIAHISLAQAPDIEWQTALGGTSDDYAESVKQTSDGGYIVVGRSISIDGDIDNNHGSYDAWVAKISSTGILTWQKSYGGSDYDEAYDVVALADGSFVVAGATSSSDGDRVGFPGITQGSLVWILKLDSNGNITDQGSYGGNFSDIARSIEQTSDGGFILAGTSGDDSGDVTENFGGLDYWIVKINASLELEWQQSLGGLGLDVAHSVVPTIDGGYFVVGEASSGNFNSIPSNGNADIGIAKLNSDGNVLWQDVLGGSLNDFGYSTIQNADGTFMIAGSTRSSDGDVSVLNAFSGFWIIKLNSNGGIIWEKTYGDNFQTAWDIKAVDDNGYVIIGEHNTGADMSFRVVRINTSGEVLWTKEMGGSGFNDSGRSIEATSDGGFIVTGITESNDGDVTGYQGGIDFWVVKLEGEVLSVSEHDFSKISVYPNPATTVLTIDTKLPYKSFGIFNMLGQEVLKKDFLSNTIDVSSLQNGLYILTLSSNDTMQSFRFVKK